MHAPLSQLLIRDARVFGAKLPALALRLGRRAPEPITGRLGKGLLLLAEQALGVVQDLRSGLTERIAERACPWLLRPIPAATVVVFEPAQSDPVVVDGHTLLSSRPVEGVVCTFRTTRPLRVAPYRVDRAELSLAPGRPAIVTIEIVATSPIPLGAALGTDVSLFVDGDREFALSLVHAMTTAAARISWQSADWDAPLEVSTQSMTRTGFGRDEALTPDADGISQAFAAMTEAFVCPDKFRFVAATNPLRERAPTLRATLVVQLGAAADPGWQSQSLSIRPHCVPAVNLFDRTAEPSALDFAVRPEPLRISGLSAENGGVYAVRDVYATDRTMLRPVRLPDRRRLGANATAADAPAVFSAGVDWDDGSVRLHLAPRDGGRQASAGFAISARVVACNRERASRVRAGDLVGRVATPGGSLSYTSIVPASPFIDRPTVGNLDLRVLLEAAVRREAGGQLACLRRTIALCFPSWAFPKEQARAFQDRIAALLSFDFKVARRRTGARSTQIGYGYTLTVNESAFLGMGELGLFGAALAEALSRCIPITAFVELAVVGAKTGVRTTYVKGTIA